MKTHAGSSWLSKHDRSYLLLPLLLLGVVWAGPAWAINSKCIGFCKGCGGREAEHLRGCQPLPGPGPVINWNTPIKAPSLIWQIPSDGPSPQRLGVKVRLTPDSISGQFNGYVQLTIEHLVPGETVRVERFQVNQPDNSTTTNALLMQSFLLTDGDKGLISGVANLNVPADVTSVDGLIVAPLSFVDVYDTHVAGRYVYRVSSPTERFAPVCSSFTVTNAPAAQSFTGQVTNGTNFVPFAYVVLMKQVMEGRWLFAYGTVTDKEGCYSLGAEPGTYEVVALKPGMVGPYGLGQLWELPPGGTVVCDLRLRTPTNTFSGEVVDAGPTPTPIPAAQLYLSSFDEFTVAYADAHGRFCIPMDGDYWTGEIPLPAAHVLGGSVAAADWIWADDPEWGWTNTVFEVKRGGALVAGTVRNAAGQPLAGVRLAGWQTDGSSTSGTTDTNGYFMLAMPPGTWHLDADAYTLLAHGCLGVAAGSVTLAAGQTAAAPLTAQATNAAIQGRLLVANVGEPVWMQDVQASDGAGNYSIATSDSEGHFSVPVRGGQWSLFVPEGVSEGVFGPVQRDIVVPENGVASGYVLFPWYDLNGIIFTGFYDALERELPVEGIDVWAICETNGASYYAAAPSDDMGWASMFAFPGNWRLYLDAAELSARGYVAPPARDLVVEDLFFFPQEIITLQYDPPQLWLDPDLSGSWTTDGCVSLAALGQASTTYVLQASEDMAHWAPVATNTAAGDGLTWFCDPVGPTQRFYRLEKR